MDLTYVYTVKRSALGRQPQFCEQGPELCDSMHTNMKYAPAYILRNPVMCAVQNTPSFARCYVNTFRASYTNTGCNHAEGGWPKDVNICDPEAVQRYRRKVEKDDGYVHCVMNLSRDLEHYVYQNNAIDMYQSYFSELQQQPKLEQSNCRIVNIYRDVNQNRPISTISWQPDGGHQFAVTYVDVDFDKNTQKPVDAYIWNVENTNSPETKIVPPCPMPDLQYNPKDANILVGCLMNGQVAVWDRRAPKDYIAICPPHVAHRDIVRSVLFINAKSGMEFFSGGTDGALKWWDLRNMQEPTEELILDLIKTPGEQQSMGNALGVSALEFEPTIPTRFMLGTENGFVVTGNRKGKNAMEKLPGKFDAHLGPVWRVERNPSFLKNFLTVGDGTARVWTEECRESSIIWTPPDRYRITDGTWSPTRISLMHLTKWNGQLCLWDLLRCQHEPVLTVQVCEQPLVYVRGHEAGALLACGSIAGDVYMLELSRNLVQSDKNDKARFSAVLERESKRERILEARMREIRLKQRQADEPGSETPSAELDGSVGETDLNQLTADYFALVRKELNALL